MLEINNLDIFLSTRPLVKSLSFTLGKGDKLAIIGEEGNGKSTLLKSILGICDYASVRGNIVTKGNRIGYLAQVLEVDDSSMSVRNFLFESDEAYYDKIGKLYKFLDELSLNDSILEANLRVLSGGEKVKVGILKLCLEDCDILFLDEPTNDIDIETLKWLESFILECDKPIMYVSHDETLLSNTANMILHLEQIEDKTECRHTIVRLDYDTYIKERLQSISKQSQLAKSERREFDKKQEKLRHILNKVEYQQSTISRNDPHGAKLLKKKMHSLKSQEKRLEKYELTKRPDVEESIFFFFESVYIPNRKVVLNLVLPELKIQNRVLAKDIKLEVVGNEHIAIIGKNGCGKTTLLKRIYEELKSRTDIKVGYMPQNYDEILCKYENVLDFIKKSTNEADVKLARTRLSSMNFTIDEIDGKISSLSNGTKAKLFLMKLVIDECDVLILDEPTRNLSPLSNPVVREVFKNFKGAIISVSHDRKYLDEVIDILYIMDKAGLTKL